MVIWVNDNVYNGFENFKIAYVHIIRVWTNCGKSNSKFADLTVRYKIYNKCYFAQILIDEQILNSATICIILKHMTKQKPPIICGI